MADRHVRGARGEAIARDYLERHGLDVLLQGYRCRLGELDLVCLEQDALVVVEVRARSHTGWVGAVASIDARKQARIIRTTRHLLMTHPSWATRPIRFDVVALTHRGDDLHIEWIRNAFSS